MKQFFTATLLTLSVASISWGQEDVDIEFGLDDQANPSTVVIVSEQANADGTAIFTGEFSELFLGGASTASTDNPGFITPASEGLLVNSGDTVSLRFLNAGNTPGNTIGAGFVNFFDPNNSAAGIQALGALEIQGGNDTSINIDGSNTPAADLVLLSTGSDGNTFSTPPPSLGEEPELLGEGEVHSHLTFNFLDPDSTPDGAVGLLAQIEVDLANPAVGGPSVVTSDPFFLILNNGLDTLTFENQAVPAFLATAVPEPTSAVVLMMTAGAIATRRRRRVLV